MLPAARVPCWSLGMTRRGIDRHGNVEETGTHEG